MSMKTITIIVVFVLLTGPIASLAAETDDSGQNIEERIAQLEAGNWTVDEQSAILADIIAESKKLADEQERKQQIAKTVGQATRSLKQRAPLVIGTVSSQLDDDSLSVFTAAAILSAGESSPAVLESLMQSQKESETRKAIVESSARQPVKILGVDTASNVRPAVAEADTRSPSVLASDDTMDLSYERTTTSLQIETSTDDQEPEREATATETKTPPQPPEIPPRPPAIPYRGQ